MRRTVSTPPPDPRREASVWLARLERGLRDGEGDGLREWLQVKPNREAITEIASLWHSVDVNRVLAGLVPRDNSRARKKAWGKALSISSMLIAVGSCLLLCIVAVSGRFPWEDRSGEPRRVAASEWYRTAVGETRTVTLRDGSIVTLNTGTRLEVSYLPNRRELYLAQGEATFVVEKDLARPFYVSAGRRQFQAIGTTFNLRELPNENVELTVTEGEVKVLHASPRIPESPARRREPITYGEATVGVSETALVEPGFQLVTHIEPDEVQARLAWQKGFLVFEDKALEDALAEMERYTHTRFVVHSPELRTLRIWGKFRTGDVGALRSALRKDFGVFSRKDTRGRVVLIALPPGHR